MPLSKQTIEAKNTSRYFLSTRNEKKNKGGKPIFLYEYTMTAEGDGRTGGGEYMQNYEIGFASTGMYSFFKRFKEI